MERFGVRPKQCACIYEDALPCTKMNVSTLSKVRARGQEKTAQKQLFPLARNPPSNLISSLVYLVPILSCVCWYLILPLPPFLTNTPTHIQPRQLTSDVDVETLRLALSHIFQRIGELIQERQQVVLDFGFGTLVADQQVADFVFKQMPQVRVVQCPFV